MPKLLCTMLIALSLVGIANAGAINYEIVDDNINFTISYEKPYNSFDVLKSGNNFILSFDTADKFVFERENFFDMPISSAYLLDDETYRKKFVVAFESAPIEPKISKSNENVIVSFAFPTGTLTGGAVDAELLPAEEASPSALPSASSYIRMIFSLAIVLIVILLVYRFLRSYASKQVFTDIPGSGRLLGKVDLEMRRSLYFYELGDVLYILSGTENSIQLVDKITDEIEINKIKSGFVKKREFGGYMAFFGRKDNSELDEDMSITNSVVADKLDNMRKKAGRNNNG